MEVGSGRDLKSNGGKHKEYEQLNSEHPRSRTGLLIKYMLYARMKMVFDSLNK